MKTYYVVLILILLLAACQRDGKTIEDIPTEITDLNAYATSEFMTENAPPEGFRAPVSFPLIDNNLTDLAGWHYTLFMSFDGVFTATSRPVQAQTTTQVWFHDVGPTRRVVTEGRGELLGQTEEETPTIEGVRLGSETFLVRDGVCLNTTGDEADLVADLRAGELIGGVVSAETSGINEIINGERVWRYDFSPDDLNLPQIRLGEDGRIVELNADLWVSPEHNVVVRYHVTMTVDNVIAFGSSLPVTGDLSIVYDLFDIGTNPNITVPFGC